MTMDPDLECTRSEPEAVTFFRSNCQVAAAQRSVAARWTCALLVTCTTAAAVLLHWRHRLKTTRITQSKIVLLDDIESHAWTTIRWARHPTKCLDVGGKSSGARLQLWTCDDEYPKNQRFIMPPEGTTGEIRWATHPELCLDTPGKGMLQLWTCSETPKENRMWTISPDGKGRIKWAANPSKCLDIPDEVQDNGWKTQIWDCDNASRRGREADISFITHAVDCVWGTWSSWTPCPVTCGGGSHMRSRQVEQIAMNGGRSCKEGAGRETGRCGTKPCGGSAKSSMDPGGLPAVTTSLDPTYKYITSSPPKIVLPITRSGGSGNASLLTLRLSMIVLLIVVNLVSNQLLC